LGGTKHVDTARIGHLDIRDEQIEAAALERVDCRPAVVGERDVVTFATEHDRQQLSHRALIVYDEQTPGGGCYLWRYVGSQLSVLHYSLVPRPLSLVPCPSSLVPRP